MSFHRFESLMQSEQSETERAIKYRLDNFSLEKLERDGVCLNGLGATWEKKMEFGKPVASFANVGKRGTSYLPWHKFE